MKSGFQHGQVLVRAFFLVVDYQLLFYPHMVEREPESSLDFLRALIPFMRDPLTRINHLLKVLPHNTITLGIRVSTCEFWGT